jgi:glycosyltransferase involved in cell wall biosynthesis
MKILWVNSFFLHPTNKGGQIRTLEMLRRLHKRNEVHYLAFNPPHERIGIGHSGEYCSHAYPIPHIAPPRRSLRFAMQAGQSLFSDLPLPVWRYYSRAMAAKIRDLRAAQRFDSIVCDFLFPAPNFDRLDDCVLFEHNVETMIWRRHTEAAPDPVRKAYFGLQARRMFRYEKHACRTAGLVIAVSPVDAQIMRDMFSAERVTHVATGVDLQTLQPPPEPASSVGDLVFIGSMDWLPNIDGITYFCEQILPKIWKEKPSCTVTIVGRTPPQSIRALGESDSRVRITGTVPDVRPYLWGSAVSIVPLRIGSGTRLKIYESMAARVPVVSTTVGAEGLDVNPPTNIRIADTPDDFARECLQLLVSGEAREQMAAAAWNLVSSRYGWDSVTRSFEAMLAGGPRPVVK